MNGAKNSWKSAKTADTISSVNGGTRATPTVGATASRGGQVRPRLRFSIRNGRRRRSLRAAMRGWSRRHHVPRSPEVKCLYINSRDGIMSGRDHLGNIAMERPPRMIRRGRWRRRCLGVGPVGLGGVAGRPAVRPLWCSRCLAIGEPGRLVLLFGLACLASQARAHAGTRWPPRAGNAAYSRRLRVREAGVDPHWGTSIGAMIATHLTLRRRES